MEEQRLEMAAITGDAISLNKLLQEKPFILSDSAMINSSSENTLSKSIKSNHLQISVQIAQTCPHFLTAIDKDGVRPLDVASAYGFVEIVRELLVLCPNPADICRLPGRDGKTAIHHASINGRIDVVDMLLAKCPDCIRDVTTFGESSIHLGVRYFQVEAVKKLVQWLETSDCVEELINLKDRDGNTVLHYAVSKRQLETVELLLDKTDAPRVGNAIKINATNANNLTPTDFLSFFIESSSDSHMKELLQRSGGRGSHETQRVPIQENPPLQNSLSTLHLANDTNYKPRNFAEILYYFRFQWGSQSVHDVRNTLLVVSALFIIVAFQGVTNLPPHIFPDNNYNNNNNNNNNVNKRAQVVYLASNTFIFSGPLTIISYLTGGMPFQREIVVVIWCMIVTYGANVVTLDLPRSIKYTIVLMPGAMISLRLMPMAFARKERTTPIRGQEQA